jgi:hypothetical protein
MNKNAENIFTDIFQGNKFRGKESISGNGSGDEQTRTIRVEIPNLLKEYGIKSIIDVPCGDFYWMKMIDLSDVQYTGIDIVKPLIESNQAKYQTDNIQFVHSDLIEEELPKADLIFCRDCFVHLSFSDIHKALRNIIESQSKYLLTTTFTNRDVNRDIPTGGWRFLNFTKAPFNFPEPVAVINENCTEGNMGYTDKSLGLWDIRGLSGRS